MNINTTPNPRTALRGFVKGIAIATVTLASAALGHLAGQLAGITPALTEGIAGGIVLTSALWYVFTREDARTRHYPVLDIPDTTVPEEIADNDFMTVVSNPPNGSGILVWDRSKGVMLAEFTSHGMHDDVWLTEREEIEQVRDALTAALEDDA